MKNSLQSKIHDPDILIDRARKKKLKVLDLSSIFQAMDEAEKLMGSRVFSINSKQIFTLMSESTCPACDCELVALASDFDIQLVTINKKILSEFPAIAIHPNDFAAV